MRFLKKIFGSSEKEDQAPAEWPVTERRMPPVRDHFIKSHLYFDRQVKYARSLTERIESLKSEMIREQGAGADFTNLYFAKCDDFQKLVAAMYSRGDAVEEIIPLVTVITEDIAKVWHPDEDYADNGNVSWKILSNSIALGVLAGSPTTHFERLSSIIRHNNFSDRIVDFLLNAKVPDHPIREGLFVPGYASIDLLAEIVASDDPDEILRLATSYLAKHFNTRGNLENYYKKHEENDGLYYYGYWAWVLAAILKAKGTDLEPFRQMPFFPFELATG